MRNIYVIKQKLSYRFVSVVPIWSDDININGY